MKLHNTLTKSVDDFAPLNGKTARVYSCGPTVYNHAHIGNLSSYIYSDILQRTLNLAGFGVQRVMNFTDVDDKTIRDSHAEFPDMDPIEALKEFTRRYEKIFLDEMAGVGNLVDEVQFVRATDNIEEMQKLILRLLKEDIAYIAPDGIYFSINNYQKPQKNGKGRRYGQLSEINISDYGMSRIKNDEYDKAFAQDFALWKKQKDGEPAWDFKISRDDNPEQFDRFKLMSSRGGGTAGRVDLRATGDTASIDLRGRPGWHIECSAMSVKELGQPFDIHTGGVDLIFPHHENEIAQSTAGDQPATYANFFVHNEHLLVDGKKMSKSAHNFYTLPDIEKEGEGFEPLDFRMLVLQSHYRSATNFTWESLTAAQNRRRNWRNVAELRWQTADANDDGQTEIVNNLLDRAKENLLDDLDTPNALATLDQAFDQFAPDHTTHFALENLIKFVDENLGLKLAETTPDISPENKNLIKERQTARDDKNFAKSDEIRNQLAEQGIEIKDSVVGSIWLRKS